jgi:hypothetical protein
MVSRTALAKSYFDGQVFPLPAPTGGWNAIDNIAQMPSKDAVQMINWWPTTTGVQMRLGFETYATGTVGQIETLMNWSGGSSDNLFAVAIQSGVAAIYDVTAGGTIGSAAVSNLSNARWEFVNIGTTGGSFLVAVNGADDLEIFDGTTWYDVNGSSTPYAITGVDTNTLNNVNLWKERLWFVQNDSLLAWYMPVNSIAGAAASFTLQGIARKGGYLVAIATWTIDAGYGMDDYLVFITNKGEVIVYAGTDPSSSTTFALIGVWELGSPVGKRCWMKYAGDVLVVMQDGMYGLASALQSDRLNPNISISYKIRNAIVDAVGAYGSNFGWQPVFYPNGPMIFLNVPISEDQTQYQYAQNTITKAWAQFNGWNSNCWLLWKDQIYFGTDNGVNLAWNGFSDNNANITGVVQQAWNNFGSENKKRWTMMRPYLQTNGSPAVLVSLGIDFQAPDPGVPILIPPNNESLWDAAIWDMSYWSTLETLTDWEDVDGLGTWASPTLTCTVNGFALNWFASDFVVERGAVV